VNVSPQWVLHYELVLDVDSELPLVNINYLPAPELRVKNIADLKTSVAVNESPVRIPLEISAVNPGRYYLRVQLTAKTRESLLSESVTVVVQVGDEKVGTETKLQKTNAPDVIVLPAQETILP
jgi:hypothetical protein